MKPEDLGLQDISDTGDADSLINGPTCFKVNEPR